MRYILILSLSLLCGVAFADGPISVSATTATWILPDRTVQSAPAWVANHTNAQGDYVKSSGSFYMALVGGTNVAAGTGPSGNGQLTSGACTWYSLPPGLRHGYAIVNASTGKVYLSIGRTAVAGKGALLMPNGGAFNETGQDAVSVVPEGGTATITALEW